MLNKIQVEAAYTPEDFARGSKYMQNRNFIVKYAFLIPIIIILLLLFMNYLANPTQFIAAFSQPDKIAVITFPILVLIGWHFYRKNRLGFIAKRAINSQFKSSPALREPKIISFDEEGIFAASQFGSAVTNWEAFIEADEAKDDFFFFTSKKLASFVPKRFFTSEQLDQIRELTKRKLGDKANF